MSRGTPKPVNMSSELSTGKTIVILAVVVGCFAVLWPKVFYPMLASSVRSSQAPSFRDPANAHFYKQLCFLLSENEATSKSSGRMSDDNCFEEIQRQCHVKLTEVSLEKFRLSTDRTNLTRCLTNFHLYPNKIGAAAPPTSPTRLSKENTPHTHVRPERPAYLHPDTMHPALREKGRPIPHRTIEKQARPGPMPGIRPPMGGGGHMAPTQTKGSGAMGILMPIYTVGIIIFFIYTIMKVIFKSDCEEDKTPKLKDFHMDPEYRKYVFAEEYLDNANGSHREHHRRHERETSKHRRRPDPTFNDTKIEDEQMDHLRRRLEETETAMERLMSQMGSVTDKLTAAKITEVLTQAQTQAKILKDGNIDDPASELGMLTMSEDFSLPLNLQRRLEELNINDIYMKGTFVGLEGHKYAVKNNILTQKEIADLEICIEKINVLSNNIGNVDMIDLKVIESIEKEKQPPDSHNEHGLQSKQKVKFDQLSLEGLSDLAQRDSDDESHSGASETGADISELKTYAYEGVITVEKESPIVVVEDYIPEANYIAPTEEQTSIQTNDKIITYLRPKSPSAIEQGTQTDTTKKMSVMDLQTTYMLKEQILQEANSDNGNSSNIKEIILDARLPIDTQLLIKDSHVGSTQSENLSENDSANNELSPYVVTSQVHLAFVGLEQAESVKKLKFIIPLTNKPQNSSEHLLVSEKSLSGKTNSDILEQYRVCPNSINKSPINGSYQLNNEKNSSIQQNIIQKCDETTLSTISEDLGVEITAEQIVKEATKESIKLLSKGTTFGKLYIDSSGYNAEGINKSDADKLSSSKGSTADLEDYEVLSKSGGNSTLLKNEEATKEAVKMSNKSS